MIKVVSLAARLRDVPIGLLPSSIRDEILDLLAECWEEFGGASESKMAPWKLLRDGGVQDLTWTPPMLSFVIERHGGMVLGSSRAERQKWTLDLESKIAREGIVGHRQVQPRASKLDVKSIADDVCNAIREGPTFNSELAARGVLIWTAKGEVIVKHGELIPNNGPQQTISGRRRRFRRHLESQMEDMGWELIPVQRAMIFKKRSESSGEQSGQ